MPDTKVSAISAITALVDADAVYVVQDIAGTPSSKYITVANLDSHFESVVGAMVAGNTETRITVTESGGKLNFVADLQSEINFTSALNTKLSGIAAGAEVNPSVVSQVDAEAGVSTAEHIWTAERVKQAIIALTPPGGGVALNDVSDVTLTTPAKGSLLAFNGSAWIDVDVGPNDQVLTADSAEASGVKWAAGGGGGGASQLSDLSDVNTSTATNRNVLVADGTDWESRALLEADISDLQSYLTAITGEAIGSLSNVTITSIAANEILKWNGSAFINNTLAEAGIAAASHTHTLSDITDSGALAALATVDTAQIDDEAVTLAKLAHMATDSFLGRDTSGTGDVEVLSASTARGILNVADGSTANPNALDNLVEDTTPQVGGDLDMNGNNIIDVHEIRLDGIPDTDHTANGPTTNSFAAGATVAAFEVCYMGSASKWLIADASAASTANGHLALSLEAKNDTELMNVALRGSYVRDDTWNWTIGGIIYLSETAGDLTQTAPTTTGAIVRILGYAVTADVIFFNPDNTYVTAP